jgi:hypothetical protein
MIPVGDTGIQDREDVVYQSARGPRFGKVITALVPRVEKDIRRSNSGLHKGPPITRTTAARIVWKTIHPIGVPVSLAVRGRDAERSS